MTVLNSSLFAKRVLHAGLSALITSLGIGLATPAAAQFIPNETLVSPHPGLIDLEFSQSRAKFAWTDPKGVLWLGGVNRDTGAFEPLSGQGKQIDTNTVANWNMFMWNGPEWLSMASGEQIYYSYYLPGKPLVAANVRMRLAVQDKTGEWVKKELGPVAPARMSHIASKDKGDPNPRIKYLDPQQNQYWRNVLNPSSEEMLTFIPPSTKSWRFASGMRALLYTQEVGGIPQVFAYMLDTRVSEQLTFDSGAKDTGRTVPWIWQAPEFDNDFVLATVVDATEVRVYRRFPGPGGVLQWQPIYSNRLPAGIAPGSPEWFTYRNKSYLFMAGFVAPNDYPTEIWLTNIDATAPLMRRITDNTLYRARNDPEVFITTKGPLIYYNRYDPSIDPAHPLCGECSEGVFRADPGLGAP